MSRWPQQGPWLERRRARKSPAGNGDEKFPIVRATGTDKAQLFPTFMGGGGDHSLTVGVGWLTQ